MEKSELHFRAHIDEIEVDKLLSFLHANSDVIIVCREFGKREHIHSTIILKQSKTTFREKLLKEFPILKGNKGYSCKEVKKPESNLRYICKGRPNDYPDILYSVYTDDEIKGFYNAYWLEHKQYEKVAVTTTEGNMACQNETPVVKVKKPSKTFMQKLHDSVIKEHPNLLESIWWAEGYKSDFQTFDCHSLIVDEVYNALATILYKALGEAVKNIDDMIFERLYRGLYASLLVKCPDKNIIEKKAVDILNKFKHKL